MLRILLAVIALLCAPSALAQTEDVVLLYRPDAAIRPVVHADLVIEEALKRTQRKYGAYRIERHTENLVRERLLEEMQRGQAINTAVVASQPVWEERMLPVWIPVDMGLSGLRIGLIRNDLQPILANTQSLADLKRFRLGVGQGWSSRQVLEGNGMLLEMAANQAALTRMLLAGRLDYFPRGVGEVFAEFDEHAPTNPELVIENRLLLYMPLPTYIFVSPTTPRLAQRLGEGLESMVRDGTLLKMVTSFHADVLRRAQLCGRRMIDIPNPLLSDKHPLKRKELWFDPFDPRTGLCAAKPTHR